ncbi:MAG: trypsin-like peptidase domain-containing protein [Oscillospiraceae bacterium]|nr:trypsin-like peptidase domain-containing protein [Oscillospiraceae bacterium]
MNEFTPENEIRNDNVEAEENLSPNETPMEEVTETVADEPAPEKATPKKKRVREEQSVEDELRELAYLEAADLDYLPKPITKVRKNGHPFLFSFLFFFILFIVLFFVTANSVFGKGWIKNMINGTGNFQSFTIPVVQHEELEDKYYQDDGRYTVEGVAKTCLPSIVTIEAYTGGTIYASYSQGSGIIMTSDGYIITNAHVIEDADLTIIVRLYDGSEYNASVVGSDSRTDLAVLKINATDLTPAQFGDSDQLELGEQVVTLGSPAGLESTVTTGIVSGLNRMISVESDNISMECIQIDAAINPGNSGGALVNMWGQVVGITSSKLEAVEYDNIGFAISINAAIPIIEELIENGGILGRPKVGISFYAISETMASIYDLPAGLYIAAIDEDCDISNTDLEVGDVITEMDGTTVTSADDVYAIIFQYSPGDEITATVLRMDEDGNWDEFEITFKLEEDTTGSIQATDESESE